MSEGKPTILWLADCPGWAYASIVQGQKKAMPEYEHVVWYVMAPKTNDGMRLRQLCAAADIIVCMFVLYVRGVPAEYHQKMVLMLTGNRPFERSP